MRRALPLLLAPLVLAFFLTGTANAQNRYFRKGESGFALTAARDYVWDDRFWGVGAGLSWKGRVSLVYDWNEKHPDFGENNWSLGIEAAVIRIPFFMLEAGYRRGRREDTNHSYTMIPLRAAVPIDLGRSVMLTPHFTWTTYTADGTTVWGTDAGLDLRLAGLFLLAAELNLDEDPIDPSRSALRAGVTLGF